MTAAHTVNKENAEAFLLEKKKKKALKALKWVLMNCICAIFDGFILLEKFNVIAYE